MLKSMRERVRDRRRRKGRCNEAHPETGWECYLERGHDNIHNAGQWSNEDYAYHVQCWGNVTVPEV